MVNMSSSLSMESQLTGGILSGLKRVVAGDSIFLTRFFTEEGTGFVSFAGTMPGKIFAVTVAPGREFIAQKRSFLCCGESVNLDVVLTQKLSNRRLPRNFGRWLPNWVVLLDLR